MEKREMQKMKKERRNRVKKRGEREVGDEMRRSFVYLVLFNYLDFDRRLTPLIFPSSLFLPFSLGSTSHVIATSSIINKMV